MQVSPSSPTQDSPQRQPWMFWCLTAVPLGCVLLAQIWGLGGVGMMPGRSAVAFLLLGAVLAAAASAATRCEWSWRSPVVWLTASVVWQGLGLVSWTRVPEPGLVLWLERAGALFTAIGLAAWCRSQPPLSVVRSLVGVGAGVLILAVICQHPFFFSTLGGAGLPFGNPNFNVGGAVPLLGLAACHLRDRVAVGWCLAGVLAALVLGTGLQYSNGTFIVGDAARAVWVGLAAMTAMAVILRLPARSHTWLISAGGLLVVSLLVALVVGVVQLPFHSPSIDYRLSLWRCAGEAIMQAPLLGSGPGSPIVSLQEQVSSSLAWLSVPSYAEHAHDEYLNVLLEGGLLGALLLLVAVVATVKPLWHRRAEPGCASLLVAWSGVLAHALIESHLSQPGPLLLLAMLAGWTWAVTYREPERRVRGWWQPMVGGSVALLLLAHIGRDFTSGGTPSMIERRAHVRMEALHDDWLARAAVAATVRDRLGNLDTWLTTEAIARAHARDFATAESLALQQLARHPVDAEGLDLLMRLRDRYRKREQIAEAERLTGVLQETATRAHRLLEQVPVNPLSRVLREKLTVVLQKFESTH